MGVTMKNLKHYIKKLSKNEDGATMVEYAIMVALIAIVSIAVITGLGKEVNQTFSVVNSALKTANG
jgi:pilus assembly protein Flp/PilA